MNFRMRPVASQSPLTFEELTDIVSSVNLLIEAVNSAGVKVSDETRREVLKESLRHHGAHLRRLKVNQTALDPYKIITWYGYILAQKIASRTSQRDIVKAMIRTLNYCLLSEKPSGGLDEGTLAYMEDFVVNELENNPDYGIGKNGLFVAFHTASMMKRRFQRSFSSGWGGA